MRFTVNMLSHSPFLIVFLQCPSSKARSLGLYLEVLHMILKRLGTKSAENILPMT